VKEVKEAMVAMAELVGLAGKELVALEEPAGMDLEHRMCLARTLD